MSAKNATVASAVGLHARPASLFVQAVNATGLAVGIAKVGAPEVDARSILGVMSLGAQHGDVVTLTADGEGADEALDGLVAMLETDLDAPHER